MLAPMFVQTWWQKQLTANTVNIHQGHGSRQFFKLADGTFNPKVGSVATLLQTGERTIESAPYEDVQNGAPYRRYKDDAISFTLTEKSGAVMNFGYYEVRDIASENGDVRTNVSGDTGGAYNTHESENRASTLRPGASRKGSI